MVYGLNFPFLIRVFAIIALIGVFVYFILSQTTVRATILSDKTQGMNGTLSIERASRLAADHKYKEAQEALLMVLQFEPSNVYANNLLAKVMAMSGETKADILKVGAVTIKRPDYKAAWEKLAILYEITGDTENARQARETANGLKVI